MCAAQREVWGSRVATPPSQLGRPQPPGKKRAVTMSASDTSAGVKVSPASEPAAGKAKVKVAPPPASSSKATVEPDISDSSAADYESLLWTCKECYIYKIQPLKNESGHRANDWNVNEWLWQGALKVTSKGNTLIIVLHDPKTFEIFATCPQKEKGNGAIDRVIDSSRYYVLRLDDGKGNHAFVGLGFREREDSYDFNATMQDHWKSIAVKRKQRRWPRRQARSFRACRCAT